MKPRILRHGLRAVLIFQAIQFVIGLAWGIPVGLAILRGMPK